MALPRAQWCSEKAGFVFLHLLMQLLSCEGQNWASSDTSRQLASFTISAPCISQVQFLDLPVLCLLSGFHGLPSFLAKPLAVNMPVLCQDFPELCPAPARVPPTRSCTRTSRGSAGTGLTSLIIPLSSSALPLLPPLPPGSLLRHFCCSGRLLGNAPSPSHSKIGCGSSPGSHMWMSRLREVK